MTKKLRNKGTDMAAATDGQKSGSMMMPNTFFKAARPALATLLMAGVMQPALAQQQKTTAPASPAPAATTGDVTLNLIHLLVQNQIITAEQADSLIRQAQAQAAQAQAQANPALSPVPAGTLPSRSLHVTYVPEIVKQQIKREAEQDLQKSGKNFGNSPSPLPDWLRRIRITGDFRLRYEWNLYDQGNAPYFNDYGAINSSANPPNLLGANGVPQLNTTQNRQRMRIRARLGIVDQVNNNVEVGFRFATGSSSSPVSPNQTSATYLDRNPLVIDKAYLNYHPTPWLKVLAGRFASPWFATDLVWDKDLNFDGIAASFVRETSPNLRPFVTAGIFPVENTSLNLPTSSDIKSPSRNKWLYAAQTGLGWLITPQDLGKVGVAYYYYTNVEGSPPPDPALCSTATADSCGVDASRPAFQQRGNSIYQLRSAPASGINSVDYEYFGLASPFHILDLTAKFDTARFDPLHLIVEGEFADNLAYDKSAVAAKIADTAAGDNSNNGNLAYMARLTFGFPEISEAYDWNVSAAYKYLESDSVLDAFTDPDFHSAGSANGNLGGTNARGYILKANLGLGHNLWFSTLYSSSTEISGLPLSEDTLQTDINARF